jgi:hypothetical protein
VRHKQHGLSVPYLAHVEKERSRLFDDIPVTLAPWKRNVDVATAKWGKLHDRRAVQYTVIAFAQSRVLKMLDIEANERQLDGFDGSPEIGTEDGSEVFVASSLPQLHRFVLPAFGELAGQPAGGDACFIVQAGRVRFVDDTDCHASLPM